MDHYVFICVLCNEVIILICALYLKALTANLNYNCSDLYFVYVAVLTMVIIKDWSRLHFSCMLTGIDFAAGDSGPLPSYSFLFPTNKRKIAITEHLGHP